MKQNEGINWSIRKGLAWEEDRDHCEERGCMKSADSNKVSNRAKARGLTQVREFSSTLLSVLTIVNKS